MKTIEQLREATNTVATRAIGSVRRMAITLTSKALWQLAGHTIDGEREVGPAEPFNGIGIAARPPSSGKPEAIVVMVGDAKNPMIIATRDEKTRAAIAGAINAGETMLFNALSVVYVKDDGTIEARTAGGTAQRLATKDDLDKLRAALTTATIAVGAGGAAAVVTAMDLAVTPETWPRGTTKLKGE